MDAKILTDCRFSTMLPIEIQLLVLQHLEIHEAVTILDTLFLHLRHLYLRYLPQQYHQWFENLTSRLNLSYAGSVLVGGNSPVQRTDQFDKDMIELGFSGQSVSLGQQGRIAALEVYSFASMKAAHRFPVREQYKPGHHLYLSHHFMRPLAETAPTFTNAQEALKQHLINFFLQAWLPGVWSDIEKFAHCRACLSRGRGLLTSTSTWWNCAARRWKQYKLTHKDFARMKSILLPLGWDEGQDMEAYAVQGLFLKKETLWEIMANMSVAFHLGIFKTDPRAVVFHQDVTVPWWRRLPVDEEPEKIDRIRSTIKRISQFYQLGTLLDMESAIVARQEHFADWKKAESADFTTFSPGLRPFGGR